MRVVNRKKWIGYLTVGVVYFGFALLGFQGKSIAFGGKRSSIDPQDLYGRWSMGCHVSASSEHSSSITNYEFLPSGTVSRDQEFYSTKDCSTSHLIARVRIVSNYRARAGRLMGDDRRNQIYTTFYTAAAVRMANRERQCGSNRWRVAVEQIGCATDGAPLSLTGAYYTVKSNILTITGCAPDQRGSDCSKGRVNLVRVSR